MKLASMLPFGANYNVTTNERGARMLAVLNAREHVPTDNIHKYSHELLTPDEVQEEICRVVPFRHFQVQALGEIGYGVGHRARVDQVAASCQ